MSIIVRNSLSSLVLKTALQGNKSVRLRSHKEGALGTQQIILSSHELLKGINSISIGVSLTDQKGSLIKLLTSIYLQMPKIVCATSKKSNDKNNQYC